MEDWKLCKFGEAVECNPSIPVKKGEIVENCEMEDINPNHRFIYPRDGKLYNGSNSKFQNGDTVFARITPCLENGKIAQVKGLKKNKGIGSTEFLVFRGKNGISDNDFVFHLCKTNLIRDTAVNSMTGASGRQRADIKAVKNIDLLLPPLSTQRRLASILNVYDDLIEANTERIKLLEETASQLYKEWFVRMRFPGYQNTKFEKGIPEGWEVKKLGCAIELAYGKALKDEDRTGGKYPVYGSSGIVGYHNKFIAQAPGIVVGRKGNVGSVFWATENFYAIDTAFFVKASLSLYFVYYSLQNQNFIEGDAAVPGLNRNQAYSNFLLIPSNDLLIRFDEIVKPIFNQISVLQQQNTQLRQIRDRLLPRLVSGKLRVPMEGKVIPMTAKPEQNIVADEKAAYKKSNPYFKRRVLAAYIIDTLKDHSTFGHVKLMKLMFLCEYLVKIETASNYHRDAAGPYDNKMMRSIDVQLKKSNWFEAIKMQRENQTYYIYKPLTKCDEYKEWFEKYYADKKNLIDELIAVFGTQKTQKVEMVATLYKAWLDLSKDQDNVFEDELVYEVLNNWHDSKKQINESRWRKCIVWMNNKRWITT